MAGRVRDGVHYSRQDRPSGVPACGRRAPQWLHDQGGYQ